MRYLPKSPADREAMLKAIGARSIDDLFASILGQQKRFEGSEANRIKRREAFAGPVQRRLFFDPRAMGDDVVELPYQIRLESARQAHAPQAARSAMRLDVVK